MDSPENYVRRLQQELRKSADPNSPLGKAIQKMKDGFTVGVGGRWLPEGFIGFLGNLKETLDLLDGLEPTGLPAHCLDPKVLGRFFGVGFELGDNSASPESASAQPEILSAIQDSLARIEGKLANQDGLNAAEFVSLKAAARCTGLSYSHVRRTVLSGELPASNNGSASHPIYRIARQDLLEWMERKKAGSVRVPAKSELDELVRRHVPGFRGRRNSATR